MQIDNTRITAVRQYIVVKKKFKYYKKGDSIDGTIKDHLLVYLIGYAL